MIYAYARVSTDKQVTDRQIDSLNKYAMDNGFEYDEIVIEYYSGKSFKRPKYEKLKNSLKPTDTLVVKEVDRLGRDWDGIKEECKFFMDNQINLIIVDTSLLNIVHHEKKVVSLEDKLVHNQVLELYCYMAQKEREKISQRTKEGLASARARGRIGGRRADTEQDAQILQLESEGYNTAQIAEILDKPYQSIWQSQKRLKRSSMELTEEIKPSTKGKENKEFVETVKRCILEENMTPYEIAKKYGKQRKTVYRICHRFNLIDTNKEVA